MSTPVALMSPAPKPLRIKRVVLTDFRAFPGPAPASFELHGKNLLVYGENGAGKSSLFHALREYFAPRSGRPLRDYKNVFSGEPDTGCSVEVEFDDGTAPVDWTIARHPASVGAAGADPRVIDAALRRACLDYRALLDTNYKHGNEEVNLFEVAVTELLRDYAVVTSGGQVSTVGALWNDVIRSKPASHFPAAITRVNQACIEFNSAFRGALPTLVPLINKLLVDLGWNDVSLSGFKTPGLTYNQAWVKRDRRIDGQTLVPELTYRTHPLTTPQAFLNEARLSALALAIYLAGRLACTHGVSAHALKLLVLDDVLIGLDHSNRLPVLDVLRTSFSDWQIVLLTHDRVWYEMARYYLGSSGAWKCLEVYDAQDPVRGIQSPVIRPSGNSSIADGLNRARGFLADHHIPAAANYTRAAFELVLKSFCEQRKVPVPFKLDHHRLDTEELLAAIEQWWGSNAEKRYVSALIEQVKLYRKVVLNPYSHGSPPNISTVEVQGAIRAVEALHAVLVPAVQTSTGPESLIEAAAALIGSPALTVANQHAALGYLRAALVASLRDFCHRKRVRVAHSSTLHSASELWQEVSANVAVLFPPPHQAVHAMIDAEHRWLVSPVTETDLTALVQADLTRLLGCLAPAGASRLFLDNV